MGKRLSVGRNSFESIFKNTEEMLVRNAIIVAANGPIVIRHLIGPEGALSPAKPDSKECHCVQPFGCSPRSYAHCECGGIGMKSAITPSGFVENRYS